MPEVGFGSGTPQGKARYSTILNGRIAAHKANQKLRLAAALVRIFHGGTKFFEAPGLLPVKHSWTYIHKQSAPRAAQRGPAHFERARYIGNAAGARRLRDRPAQGSAIGCERQNWRRVGFRWKQQDAIARRQGVNYAQGLLTFGIHPGRRAWRTRLGPDRSIEHYYDAASLIGHAQAGIGERQNQKQQEENLRQQSPRFAKSPTARLRHRLHARPKAKRGDSPVLRLAMVQVKPQGQPGKCGPNRGYLHRSEREPIHATTRPLRRLRNTNSWYGTLVTARAYLPPLRKASRRTREQNSRNRRS